MSAALDPYSRKPSDEGLFIPRDLIEYLDAYTAPDQVLRSGESLPSKDEMVAWQANRNLYLHLLMLYERENEE